MAREIQLDGAEISIIKALGASSSEIDGGTLISRCQELEVCEIVDALRGLMAQGYVEADSNCFYSEDDMEEVNFRINSGYSKDLKEAIDPSPVVRKSKR